MSTSLKPVLGRQLRGMRHLESKISDLQNQHQLLLKERQQEIASLLTAVDLAHLDDKTLMGGLLFLKEKSTTQDPILEAWRDAGEKFLRRTKSKTCPGKGGEQAGDCPRSREKWEEDFPYPHKQNGAEQAGAYLQIPSKNTSPPKQTSASQTTDQSSQKQPREREE